MKKFTVFIVILTAIFVSSPQSMSVFAACENPGSTVEAAKCGNDNVTQPPKNCSTATNESGKCANDTLKNVINTVSYFAGAVAVLMVIIGGFRYVTSGGESAAVTGAKNTILYAVIGLVIVAFAQVIVKFVLHNTTK